MTTLLTDVGYALRLFVKKPAFALTAILTLALGVNAVLLRPLPYAEPDRLVHIASDMRNRNVEDFPWPPADFHDLRTTASSFSGVAALVTGRQVFISPGQIEAEQVNTGAATPNLFRVLGAWIVRGSLAPA